MEVHDKCLKVHWLCMCEWNIFDVDGVSVIVVTSRPNKNICAHFTHACNLVQPWVHFKGSPIILYAQHRKLLKLSLHFICHDTWPHGRPHTWPVLIIYQHIPDLLICEYVTQRLVCFGKSRGSINHLAQDQYAPWCSSVYLLCLRAD